MSAVVTKPKKPITHVGFGCSVEPGTARLTVDIPLRRHPDETVYVFEDFGGAREILMRIPQWKWDRVAPQVQEELNNRLKRRKQKVSRWKRGPNFVERMLGLELLLLLYAIEDAAPMDLNRVTLNWMNLKPEERWWLGQRAKASDGYRGWREAVGIALLDKNQVSA